MRVGFAGTPEFARAALAALMVAGFDIVLVLTQPDRPAGRGMRVVPSPVKACAVERGLSVVQPRSLRLPGRFADDALAAQITLQAAQPDVLVVAAYGLLLPPWLLELPRLGCLNIHASLLPRWRGAAPIQRAIEAGDVRTGVTIMQMDAGLDTGATLLAEAIDIHADDSAATLTERLAALGGRLIVEALGLAACGGLRPEAQPPTGASYAHKIEKSEAPIDWRASACAIERRMRAFDPFPGASFEANGEPIKCWRAECVAARGRPGEVLSADAAGPVIACGEGALRLLTLQRPGGRRLPAARFVQAQSLAPGTILSSPPS